MKQFVAIFAVITWSGSASLGAEPPNAVQAGPPQFSVPVFWERTEDELLFTDHSADKEDADRRAGHERDEYVAPCTWEDHLLYNPRASADRRAFFFLCDDSVHFHRKSLVTDPRLSERWIWFLNEDFLGDSIASLAEAVGIASSAGWRTIPEGTFHTEHPDVIWGIVNNIVAHNLIDPDEFTRMTREDISHILYTYTRFAYRPGTCPLLRGRHVPQ